MDLFDRLTDLNEKNSTDFNCTKLQCGFAGVTTDIMCDHRGTMLNFFWLNDAKFCIFNLKVENQHMQHSCVCLTFMFDIWRIKYTHLGCI